MKNYVDVRDGTHDTPAYVSQGVPLITGKNLSDGNILFDKAKYISEKDANKINERSYVGEGDIIFAMIGSIGNPVLVQKTRSFCIKNLALLKKYIPISLQYVVYLMQLMQEQMKKEASGGVQAFIPLNYIRNFLIPIPSEAEQARIVDRIKTLEPFIEDYDKANTKLTKLNTIFPEQIKKSILQYAIQGKLVPQDPSDEPASVLLEKIKAEKQKLIKAGKIKKDKVESYIYKRDNRHYEKIDDKEVDITDEIPFEIPDNWAWTRLGHIGFSRIGLTYKPQDICEEGTPVLRSGNIQNGEIILNNMVHVNCEVSHNLLVKNGDILICVRNGSKSLVGKNAIINSINVGEKMSFGAFMAIFRSKLNEYIKIYLDSALFKTMLKSTKTETINQITQSNLNQALIPIPPYTEQKRIVEKIEQLFKTLS